MGARDVLPRRDEVRRPVATMLLVGGRSSSGGGSAPSAALRGEGVPSAGRDSRTHYG